MRGRLSISYYYIFNMKGDLNMSNYHKQKEKARNEAINWQSDFGNHNYSYGELAVFGNYFEKNGQEIWFAY